MSAPTTCRVPLLPEEGRGIARVIRDADVQYVIDVLVHAHLALDLVQGMTAFDDDEEGEGRVIDNAKTRALIDCALCRLAVDRAADLPVREISSCSDREGRLISVQIFRTNSAPACARVAQTDLNEVIEQRKHELDAMARRGAEVRADTFDAPKWRAEVLNRSQRIFRAEIDRELRSRGDEEISSTRPENARTREWRRLWTDCRVRVRCRVRSFARMLLRSDRHEGDRQ